MSNSPEHTNSTPVNHPRETRLLTLTQPPVEPLAAPDVNDGPRRTNPTRSNGCNVRFGIMGHALRSALCGLTALLLVLSSSGQHAEAAKRKQVQAKRDKPAPAGVVNINTADEKQLSLLPGIGQSKARAIIQYRTKRAFRAPHELVRIKGIGRKSFRKLRPYIAVTGLTTLKALPKPPSARAPVNK